MNIINSKLNNINYSNKNKVTVQNIVHHLPSTNEWYNSTYSFNKNIYFETSIKDKTVYNLIKSYMNSLPKIIIKNSIKRK
jgi:hypothetical protein